MRLSSSNPRFDRMIPDSDTLKLYMQNIQEFPLITPKEEKELARLIAGGDQQARYKLINSNLRLVVKIAHDFKGRGLPLLDLIGEGNHGLIKAVEKFDPSKGAKFSSYAAWWIKQAMRRALSNQVSIIRVPVQSAAKMMRIKNAIEELTAKLDRQPTVKEVAAEVKFTERTVNGLRHGRTVVVGIHDALSSDGEGELLDLIADANSLEASAKKDEMEMAEQLMNIFAGLDEREQQILDLRFGLSSRETMTLEQVSNQVGLTRERIRQIQNQALAQMRLYLDDDKSAADLLVRAKELHDDSELIAMIDELIEA